MTELLDTSVQSGAISALRNSPLTKSIQRLRLYEPVRFSIPTIRYAVSRPASQFCYLVPWAQSWVSRSRLPWWSYESLAAIDSILRECDGHAQVFEYGSGHSTRWLAERCGQVMSVESDPEWYWRTKSLLRDKTNCELLLVPSCSKNTSKAKHCHRSEEREGCFDDYVRTIDQIPNNSLDLVIVDGFARNACLSYAKPKVRPGGHIYLDDAQRKRYEPGLLRFHGWDRWRTSGIRPRSLPNEGILLRRPARDP